MFLFLLFLLVFSFWYMSHVKVSERSAVDIASLCVLVPKFTNILNKALGDSVLHVEHTIVGCLHMMTSTNYIVYLLSALRHMTYRISS